MRLSVIVGDQGWYWSGRADGKLAYQRWGVWGSKGVGWYEDCGTPEAAEAKVKEWAAERRQLGYEDDPREEPDFFDQIALGPWVPLPSEVFAPPPEPELVRELKKRRHVLCFSVHPSSQKVLLAMGGEVLEYAKDGSSKRVVMKLPAHPSALWYLTDPYFAVSIYRGIEICDANGNLLCRIPGGREYLVAIRSGRVLVNAGTTSAVTSVRVHRLDGHPPSVLEIGQIEFKGTDDGPALGVYQGEAYLGADSGGYLILNIDQAEEFALNPPPRYPPGLK